MLTEFAFTPSIFDEDAHEDKEAWRDQLKELGRNMFPRVSAWPVVVSDLYAGSWNQVADQTVKAIKDQRARVLCEGILQNMKKTLVPRPVCGEWPDEDVAWGREAIASANVESIERIVANSESKAALIEEYRLIRSLDEVEDGGFWQGIAADASPKMVIADQVQLLRKLCLHSEWIALISKDMYGGSDDETDFALGVIDVALNRPADFGAVDFELHTEGPRRFTDDADYETKKAGLIRAISGRVKDNLAGTQSIDLLVWRKLLDRFLIAGTYTTESGGVRKKSPRWGVLLSHIARSPDEKKDDFFTEWKLLNSNSLLRWFAKYVVESADDKPAPITIDK